MSTINLGFTSGHLTSVDATVAWYATYYLDGHYITSTAEAPGHYVVVNENEPGWNTYVDNHSFQHQYGTDAFLAFKDPPVGGMATPELGTWAMMLVGFALLAYVALDKRVRAKAVL